MLVEIDVQISLLKDKLDEHAFFIIVFLVKLLQFELFLTFFLFTLNVYFFNIINYRLHVIL